MFGFPKFVLRLAALLSFCGAPLFIADLLKPSLTDFPAFAVAFAPHALVIYAALLTVDGESNTRFRTLFLRASQAIAVLLTIAHATVIFALAYGVDHSSPKLIIFGCTVGIASGAYFLYISRRYLLTQRSPV